LKKFIVNFIKFFFFFFLFLNAAFANFVKSIDIIGLDSISRGTVLNYMPIEINDQINSDSVELIAKKLKETNLFKSVKVDFDGKTLYVRIQENPIIKYFDFVNYKNDLVLSDSLIDEIKKNYNLSVGKLFDEKKLKLLVENLISIYQNNAFYQTKIDINTELDDSNRVGIELFFTENSPSLISSFEIHGSNFFETDDLLDLFSIGEPDLFFINYFTERDRFDNNAFESGIESLRNKYINSGFLDVKINKNVKLSANKKNILIKLDIDEGNQYKIGKISFKGIESEITDIKLIETLKVKEGDVFSRKEILKGIEKIRDLFSDKGYAYSSAETKIINTERPNVYDLEINIDKKSMIYVNRIEISGNNRTQDEVIRRELDIIEGQLYSKSEIDESLKKVRRLGYFSDVSLSTTPENNDSDRMDIFISVEETKTGEISIGLSQSSSTGAAFTGGIEQSNIFGTGNTFNGRFVNSSAVTEISFFFSDPYYTKEGNSLSYGLFNKSTNAAELEISDYNLDENGFTIGYGIPVNSDSNIQSSLRFASLDLKCSSVFSSSLYEQEQCNSNDDLDTTVKLSYQQNSLNDFYSPTNGSKTLISSSLAIPIGDFKYYQFEASNINYLPLNETFTLLTKNRIQVAQGYGDKTLPFFKRYFGGGSSSVRGFDFNSLGSKYDNGKAKGGEIAYLSSVNIITPGKTVGIDNENIRVGAFFDIGSIEEKVSKLSLSDIRASTGLGVSWLTPIGPIGFHAATPILKQTGDSLKSISFDLGMSF